MDPLWVGDLPGSDDLVVIEKTGFIRRFPNSPDATPGQMKVVLDLSASVQVSEDQGLYQIAFHPDFGKAGFTHANDVFITYNHRPAASGAGPNHSVWRLSRFRWQPALGTIDPSSESVLIQQYDPHRWHNGGAMAFDASGFLLVTCGDGGGANGEFGLIQKRNGGFFGGVLRIDVDNDPARSHAIRRQPASPVGGAFASFSQGYGIPNDNPWLSTAGTVLEEFYAIGLRSPHSMSLDPVTGEIWVGDVGQSAREELNLIKRGANYEWPFMEGTLAGPVLRSKFTVVGIETPPVYSYDRTEGGCVLTGGRYQGAKWSALLGGGILFADNSQGALREMKWDPDGGPPVVRQIVSGLGIGIYSGISGICTDAAGEIYILKLNGESQPGGTIRKLATASTAPTAPALLSATGLFSDTRQLVPSPALRPYEVASPLWSDGASKRRWLVIPNDGNRNLVSERILYSATGNWSFPEGSVFVKHFEMPVDARNPSVVKRLETRVIVCTPGGSKYGLTYRWNEQGTDAVLLTDGAEETFAVTGQDGSTETRTWSYPSRANCLECHGDASGQALGLRTHQMNLPVQRPVTGEIEGQLQLLNEERLFTTTNEVSYAPSSLSAAHLDTALESRRIDDVAAPLEHRVRSYLDSNCAHCHQPNAAVPYFDARLQTPLASQRLMNEAIRGQFHLPGGATSSLETRRYPPC
ncbi:PQQ-dependent sugar dehydrogenase [Luteolibacter flavescens]|uniref:PQQ-dependent sugar dehydrogenase n=1 Tax=Luteolibacter flavescens TaxID=1859460 RepID=UPI002222426F|nr:PQQ-dependent sugar dehydrogenase [Luteolibacter flavescens]